MITLATLPQASAQEVFDQVANHLLTQKEKSEYEDGCAYRGHEGRKCAAGCLISDEEYNRKYEGCSWRILVNDFGVTADHSELIRRLQLVHDDDSPKNWKSELSVIANIYSLDKSVLENYV